MKIICVGRNYFDHVKELDNPVPNEPLVFMKPSTALLINNDPMYIPDFTDDLHYEGEIVLHICKNGRHVQPDFVKGYYDKIALGIDFTARDVQKKCKDKGHPWEIAKAFDKSAGLSKFISVDGLDMKNLKFQTKLNGEIVQDGNTKDLIFDFEYIICYVSQFFKLHVGDLIYTGTPAGVGSVKIGDTLEGSIEGKEMLNCLIK